MTSAVVRPRRAEDLPALEEELLAQQPSSRYPFRDPLPIPVSRFLHADDASGAWTAEATGWREVLRLRPEWLAAVDAGGTWEVRVMALPPERWLRPAVSLGATW